MSGEYESDDETIVVNDPGAHGAVAGERPVDDATVVVPQLFDDATVVAPQASVETPADDATIVAAQPAPLTDDATVVVSDATVVVNDPQFVAKREQLAELTVVVPSAPQPRKRRSELRDQGVQRTATEAPPVAEPADDRTAVSLARSSSGLDPERLIAPAPGTMPWELPPSGERGVTQGLPVSYGARSESQGMPPTGPDEVQRRLGPAPQGHHVQVRGGREVLPSLVRRDRKRRVATLAGYAAALLVCVLGLWGVASIAFG